MSVEKSTENNFMCYINDTVVKTTAIFGDVTPCSPVVHLIK
jgi:hypothetical protein